jgi:hypothetical protein
VQTHDLTQSAITVRAYWRRTAEEAAPLEIWFDELIDGELKHFGARNCLSSKKCTVEIYIP